MAVTYESFIERFPHFAPQGAAIAATEAMIRAEIAMAIRAVYAAEWGDLTDDAVGLLAAHRIAKNPAGQFARLVNKDGSTNYIEEFKRLQAAVVSGDRVV